MRGSCTSRSYWVVAPVFRTALAYHDLVQRCCAELPFCPALPCLRTGLLFRASSSGLRPKYPSALLYRAFVAGYRTRFPFCASVPCFRTGLLYRGIVQGFPCCPFAPRCRAQRSSNSGADWCEDAIMLVNIGRTPRCWTLTLLPVKAYDDVSRVWQHAKPALGLPKTTS